MFARPSIQCAVMQTDSPGEYAVVDTYNQGGVVAWQGDQQSHGDQCQVWRDMAAECPQRVAPKRLMLNRAVVPPHSCRRIKVRMTGPGHISEQMASTVQVICQPDWRLLGGLVRVQAWDPERGEALCRGHPSVVVFNDSDVAVPVAPTDIQVLVTPMRVHTRYFRPERVGADETRVRMSNTMTATTTSRPEAFPADLWPYASPEDQALAAATFGTYEEAYCRRCVDALRYDLQVHADGRAVSEHPWVAAIQPKEEGVEAKDGSRGEHTEVTEAEGEEAWKRVQDFFRNAAEQRYASKEWRDLKTQWTTSRRIEKADIIEYRREETKTEAEPSDVEDEVAEEDTNVSEEERAQRAQERIIKASEEREQRLKAEEEEKKRIRRAKRDEDMFSEGKPTEMAYMVAQAIAHLSAYYHRDPDNPPTVKGLVAEIETVDEVPVRAHARKLAEVQKAYVRAMTRGLIRQGKLEESHGEWASALVLVPYKDRIKSFMDRWGDEAMTNMWMPEHEAEVATFYRCTCDYRALNQKSKSDVYPLPRIDDLLDHVAKGTKHFSMGDIQNAFWTLKLDEKSREKTAIRTHDALLQWTVMPQGWKGAANYWARVVAKVFEGIPQAEALVYQDDVMAHSREFRSHWSTLGRIYRSLEDMDLTFKLKKTHLNMPYAVFLGHAMDEEGRYPSLEKVRAIMEKDYPRDVTGVRSFIGMTLYYRNYVHDYAEKIAPLHALTRKGVDVAETWGD